MKVSMTFITLFFSAAVLATDFGISSESRIAQGDEISFTATVEVPANDGFGAARDAVKLSDGTLLVYNGTFEPVLSVYANGIWADLDFAGWSTANNVSYGGIASDDRYVWVTDMDTGSGAYELNGIVRFDLDGVDADVRFADGIDAIDLTLGKDGLLYALYPGGSPGGRFIDVYNPNDSTFIKTINLVDVFGFTEHRSIAVDANSNIYIADWDGDIQMMDRDNNIIATNNVGGSLYDVDIVDGKIITGDRFGQVYIGDLQLQGFVTHDVEDLDPIFNGSGVFILGDSVNPSDVVIDLIFADDFED